MAIPVLSSEEYPVNCFAQTKFPEESSFKIKTSSSLAVSDVSESEAGPGSKSEVYLKFPVVYTLPDASNAIPVPLFQPYPLNCFAQRKFPELSSLEIKTWLLEAMEVKL